MRRAYFSIATAALFGFSALVAFGPARAADAPRAATAADRTALSLTIYDGGSALIEETRRVRLPAEGSLAWRDVPKTIVPASIQVSGPAGLKVFEERFLYDPMTHERLLRASRGGKVFLVERVGEKGEERRSEAVLLAAEGPPVFQVGKEIHLGHPGRVVLPSLPDGLYPEPEIVWRLEAPAGEADLTARYLAGGVKWRADYVMLVTEADLTGELSGAFSITNTSGTGFEDASVQLIAGVVRRAEARAVMLYKAAPALAERTREAPVADLHRYTVDGPVTVADGRTLRLGFLQAEGLKLGRRYETRGGWVGFGRPAPNKKRLPVAVVWLLANTAEAGLGRPLPGGTVRVYVSQGKKPLLLAGEVRLAHTPAGVEEVKLETGEAFDIVATRRQTAFRRLSKELSESSWKVRVENKKSAEATVRIIERIPAQAELIASSHRADRKSADRLLFDVAVPAGDAVEVTYRIRVGR